MIPPDADTPVEAPVPAPSSPAFDSGRQFIVAIGASAGGLEALSVLISHLPTDLNIPFVVLQHLSPTYRSMLAQLLGRETTMSVVEIEDGTAPQPNCIYTTPPNRNLELRDDRFRLIEPTLEVLPKPSVNTFMYSLAEARGEDVIGVILSGTGSDGASGLRAVKASGGLTFAQDPATAKYTGMPQSAIDTECVDWVMPPAEIAQEIARLVRTHGQIPSPAQGESSPATLKTLLSKVQREDRMVVGLGTQIEDPLERLRFVHQEAINSKAMTNAVGAKNLSDYSKLMPSALAGRPMRSPARNGSASRWNSARKPGPAA